MSPEKASLSYRARREVLVHLAERSQGASRAQKTLLLDRVVNSLAMGGITIAL